MSSLEALYVGFMFIKVFGLLHVLGEQLTTQQEYGNPEDRYAVAVLKSSRIVGHVPRPLQSFQCWGRAQGYMRCASLFNKRRQKIIRDTGWRYILIGRNKF